ncbi:release factor glutamine methyltransferase [Psychromonas marina]|uniref:Release factor glutamine methyltransferase n=1 Tax=Psychromonas marina TaxID=88364 RepID=A0ABQ6E190_9GAMM|nr:peptide chain release factor N(5)-glutamine methyltransferase [Psychromonas marina]GLS91214.1 release factor glutamine methyltransferase [Psychromonas marina]
MRIDDALVWAKFLLSTSDSPLLDAQVLLAHVLEKETVYLMTWPERDLSAEQKSAFEALVEQRLNGVPVAHLTGTREFWSLPLKVNDSTLIPRPDTEILVETALGFCAPNATILDLGTGTGAIILALASELPLATCCAVDFSDDAVQLARENAAMLNINNVTISQSDWFGSVQGQFDVIVSNPPYIDENDHHLKKGDVRFEPLSALVASENGLSDIRLIAQQARDYLNENGCLLIEHGFEQGNAVREIFSQLAYGNIKTIKDYGDNDRITIATYKR